MTRSLRLSAALLALCLPGIGQAASWRHVTVPGGAVLDLAVLPGGALYAGTNDGVYRSDNAGDTWTRTHGVSVAKAFLRVHAVDGDPLKLVAYTRDLTRSDGLALETSRDGGATWQVTFTYPLHFGTGDFASHPSTPGVILFVESHLLLRSEDGGMTWTDFSSNQHKRNAFPLPDRPGHFIAPAYRIDRMLESNDGGRTWTNLELQSHLPQIETRFEQDPGQPWLVYYAAYEYGVQVALSGSVDSRTGLVTPFNDHCGCSHVRVVPDPHRQGRLIAPAVAFDAATGALTGRPIRESLDGGATWHELSRLSRKLEDEYRWQFDPWLPGRVYFPTAGAGIYRSDNDGLSFTQRYQGMNAGVVAHLSVDPTNPADFLVARQLLPMLHSSDGGESFSAVRRDFYSDLVSPAQDRPRIARAWDEPNVLIGFDRQSFYRSEDGGRSWEMLTSDFPFDEVWINAVQFSGSGSDRLVALTEHGELGNQMYWSSDGGRHWTSSDFGGWGYVNRLGTGSDDLGPVYARRENYNAVQASLWVADGFGSAPRFVDPPSSDMFFYWTMSAPDPSNAFRMLAFSEDWSTQNRPREVFETHDAGNTWIRTGRSNILGGIPVVDACDGRTVWESISGAVSRDGGRYFGPAVTFSNYLANGFHALCFQGKSHVLTQSSRGISIREPEAGDTLLKEGHDP